MLKEKQDCYCVLLLQLVLQQDLFTFLKNVKLYKSIGFIYLYDTTTVLTVPEV